MKDYRSKRSFTLIELLLGISIFATIAMTLYMTFLNGIRINRKAQNTEALYQEINWIAQGITLDLENMVPYRYSSPRSEKGVAPVSSTVKASGIFSGQPTSLSLLLATEKGLKVIRYYFQVPEYGSIYQVIVNRSTHKNVPITTRREEQHQKTGLLVREEIPFSAFDASQSASQGDIEILSQHVQEGSLKFFYLYRDTDQNQVKMTWKDQWDEAFHPMGFRIEMAFVDPTQEEKPFKIQKDIFIPTSAWGNQEY